MGQQICIPVFSILKNTLDGSTRADAWEIFHTVVAKTNKEQTS